MKNYILLLMLFCFSINSLTSQNLLLKGGLNFTNVSQEKDINLSTSNGFHAGLGFEMPLFALYELGTGIYYTRRGYKSNDPGREGNVSIDYLDIPIDFMLKFKLADLIGAFISAGPYLSYGVSSKVFNIDGILKDGYNEDDIDLNRIDSGVNLGAGVDFSNFRLSGAYGFSFTNNGSIEDNVVRNRVLKLSLGYVFY